MKLDEQTRSDALKLAELALDEDLGGHDLSTARDCTTLALVPDDWDAAATFVSRQEGILCGLSVCQAIINQFSSQLRLEGLLQDGDSFTATQPIAALVGDARQILMLERTCLNFLCRLSGISSLTNEFVQRVAGTEAVILDTRKTLPGWRRLEKYAVACGGGHNHRMGLFDAILIKDNHLSMYGNLLRDHRLSVSRAVELARTWVRAHAASLPHGEQTMVQIEVDTLEQLRMALPAAPDIVLLDNMRPASLSQAVAIRNEVCPDVLLEASGGVNLQTVHAIAETGVDRISVGAITHSAVNLDIGLDWLRLSDD